MSATVERIKSELAELTEEERAELAQFLIDSLHREWDPDAEAAWDDELAQRAAEIKSGTVTGKPADVLFAELHEKYS
jgi:putative addiction module component (TIGR02574 family)